MKEIQWNLLEVSVVSITMELLEVSVVLIQWNWTKFKKDNKAECLDKNICILVLFLFIFASLTHFQSKTLHSWFILNNLIVFVGEQDSTQYAHVGHAASRLSILRYFCVFHMVTSLASSIKMNNYVKEFYQKRELNNYQTDWLKNKIET